MGWFWADSISTTLPAHEKFPGSSNVPPPGCPMHVPKNDEKKTISKISASGIENLDKNGVLPSPDSKLASSYSQYNPLNYMFSYISQAPAKDQSVLLPTERESSSIPKGTGEGNWEYPSPQQMYNALLRKGYTDTDANSVESMVSVHNFLNEGAWAEILEWERKFGKGLMKGLELSINNRKNVESSSNEEDSPQPSLISFVGRPKDMTPKATLFQLLGKIYPTRFGTDPPFDRHDWYVQREFNGKRKQIRYVIDYYAGPDDSNGEPVFFLDVRPAITPLTAVERIMNWGGDVWSRASGAAARENSA
ncbi:unnamed protein product [Blumeria hordei]|uniref:Holocytochrome c-type synthase n=2 Tax=Blumeria hordei TaxID=2867405 RepID=A0A383V195_BLUHO|nr:putative cytochrome c heme lyase [Blumeria hordei DH14]SZF06393.1 unnamed protein product [Blumeria hordei]